MPITYLFIIYYLFIYYISRTQSTHKKLKIKIKKNKKTDRKREQSAHTQVTNDIRHITSRKNIRQTSQTVSNHYAFLQS